MTHSPLPTPTRAALALSIVAALGLGAVVPAAAAPAGLDTAFTSAARSHDVPKDLLIAVGWSETRLDGHQGRPSQDNGFGPMHLVSNSDHRTLDRAAALTGHDRAELTTDGAANIDGAAAVLDELADQARLSDADRDDPAAWLDLVPAYSGLEGAPAQLQIEAVRDTLAEGLDATVDGGAVTLAARPMPAVRQSTTAASSSAAAAEVDQPGALWVPACACNQVQGRKADITTVVIHTTQGSYAGSISWYQNPEAEVSAHYTIRSSDGQITQSVREANTAWHASAANSYSVGIEHEGYVDDASWYTEAMYRSSAALVKGIAARHDIPLDRQHIIGHVEAPGATHTDPGPNWNWAHYMELLGGTNEQPSDPITFTNYQTQRQGSSGAQVTAIQTLLTGAGHSPGAVDGQFGSGTAAAVKAFQSSVGLSADGIVGSRTWTALLSVGGTGTVTSGSTGEGVKRVQRALTARLGRVVGVDGSFGPTTTQAVKDYQSAVGLTADGVVGAKTWQALQRGA